MYSENVTRTLVRLVFFRFILFVHFIVDIRVSHHEEAPRSKYPSGIWSTWPCMAEQTRAVHCKSSPVPEIQSLQLSPLTSQQKGYLDWRLNMFSLPWQPQTALLWTSCLGSCCSVYTELPVLLY